MGNTVGAAPTTAGDYGFRPIPLSHPAAFSAGLTDSPLRLQSSTWLGVWGSPYRYTQGIPADMHIYGRTCAQTLTHERLRYMRRHDNRTRTHIYTFPLAASVFSVGILQIQLHSHVLDSLKKSFTQSEINPGVIFLARRALLLS